MERTTIDKMHQVVDLAAEAEIPLSEILTKKVDETPGIIFGMLGQIVGELIDRGWSEHEITELAKHLASQTKAIQQKLT